MLVGFNIRTGGNTGVGDKFMVELNERTPPLVLEVMSAPYERRRLAQ